MIESRAGLNGGAPTLLSRSQVVGTLVLKLEGYRVLREFMTDYKLQRDELLAMLRYCRDQRCVSDKALRFCPGCQLDKSGADLSPEGNARAQAEALFGGKGAFAGSAGGDAKAQAEALFGGGGAAAGKDAAGKPVWLIAQRLHNEIQNARDERA